MDTIQIMMDALASALTGTWRWTGRYRTDEQGNQLLDKKGKPLKEYAVCVPEGTQAGESCVVHKQRSGEIAVFVLRHRAGWRTENGIRQGMWTGFQRINPFTGEVLEQSTNAVVELDGE